MKIGILTFYRVSNFGANLQALSTYHYLIKNGHTPILIYYETYKTSENNSKNKSIQSQTHIDFLDRCMPNQTEICRDAQDINNAIDKYGIEAIIVGSDAVVQHHPLLSRIHKGHRKPFYISDVMPERMFPNPFWGIGITSTVPMVMMSVSSQNSNYTLFSKKTKRQMYSALSRMKYISVRDSWTQKMMLSVLGKDYYRDIAITPDPVFAFNNNVQGMIPSEENIRKHFHLPENYVLVCLNGQNLEVNQLQEIDNKLAEHDKHCVAFPLPTGIKFKHPFKYSIDIPLEPIDWYALIMYASGYIGCNMHPIVVSLHNAVPCFSIDHWGTRDFWGNQKDDNSSKVADILKTFGIEKNRAVIENGKCNVETNRIIMSLLSFPKSKVHAFAEKWAIQYEKMLNSILKSI